MVGGWDLAEARRLIERHGYWRRKEELEDAETAARQRHPLNRGCGESGFVTINPGVAGY
jgi:hypothetical protein